MLDLRLYRDSVMVVNTRIDRKLYSSQGKLYPKINLRYLDRASSCDRRRGSGPPLRDTGGHVHRVPDAQEGRGLVRPGRAEEIARGAGLP